MMNGIINVYKEAGYTSHDVVARLRGIFKQKKIGHTGTLDPDAVGVLPICLGNATKLCDMLTDTDKTYEAVVQLGLTTDTQDMSGTILEEKDVCATEDEVVQVLGSFVGSYMQIPPMYSALKVNGRKLYELARAGQVVERKPRQVYFHDIEILEMALPKLRIRVRCSKGTYIRTLCHDIGQKLSCGACMASLIRTEAAGFSILESKKLEEIEILVNDDTIHSVVRSVESMFPTYTKVVMASEFNSRVYNGNVFANEHLQEGYVKEDGQLVLVYDSEERFLGIYRYVDEQKLFTVVKMFLPI